jgi:hypothetical protein
VTAPASRRPDEIAAADQRLATIRGLVDRLLAEPLPDGADRDARFVTLAREVVIPGVYAAELLAGSGKPDSLFYSAVSIATELLYRHLAPESEGAPPA